MQPHLRHPRRSDDGSRFHKFLTAFGFGSRSGVDFPGESPGVDPRTQCRAIALGQRRLWPGYRSHRPPNGDGGLGHRQRGRAVKALPRQGDPGARRDGGPPAVAGGRPPGDLGQDRRGDEGHPPIRRRKRVGTAGRDPGYPVGGKTGTAQIAAHKEDTSKGSNQTWRRFSRSRLSTIRSSRNRDAVQGGPGAVVRRPMGRSGLRPRSPKRRSSYLGVPRRDIEPDDEDELVRVPNVMNLDVRDAEEILLAHGLKVVADLQHGFVVDQTPPPGRQGGAGYPRRALLLRRGALPPHRRRSARCRRPEHEGRCDDPGPGGPSHSNRGNRLRRRTEPKARSASARGRRGRRPICASQRLTGKAEGKTGNEVGKMAISLSQLIRHVGGARITRSPQHTGDRRRLRFPRRRIRATSLFVSGALSMTVIALRAEAVRQGRGGAFGREGAATRRAPDRRRGHEVGDGPSGRRVLRKPLPPAACHRRHGHQRQDDDAPISSALSSTNAGRRCGLIGTVVQSTGADDRPASGPRRKPPTSSASCARWSRTAANPPRWKSRRTVWSLKGRSGVEFDIGVFTNLLRTISIFTVRLRIISKRSCSSSGLWARTTPSSNGVKCAVVNGDDPNAEQLSRRHGSL